jgi:hypothetical protein
MRFEVAAAYGVGLLLPAAEVARRKTDFSDPMAYLDDFIVGALLFGQLARRGATDVSGLPGTTIVAVKGALYLVGLIAAVQSVRGGARAGQRQPMSVRAEFGGGGSD